MYRRVVTLACLALLGAAGAARADIITEWNEELLNAVRTNSTNPPRASRIMAIVHVSMFEAANGIVGTYAPYQVTEEAPAGASVEAAIAQAAHRALSALFPNQVVRFDQELFLQLLAIPEGPAKADGVTWGFAVAGQILDLRADDGSDAAPEYLYPTGAGWWAQTPPGFAPALLPGWPQVTTWSGTSGSHFRLGPPPPPNSAEYTNAFLEVKRLGRANSPFRTAEQSEIALFWADGGGTETPPGHWLRIAEEIADERGLTLLEKTRLLALVSITVADAAIVSWDHKFAYHHWRPVTAIQNADTDGNPDTSTDAAWTSFIVTPPFPAYTSGHSTFSGSSARLLALFFGTDAVAFSTTSNGLPTTRSFTSLSQAAEEAGQSRIYGGIHWQYDNQVALASGRTLGEHVFFTQLGPLGVVGPCGLGTDTLCLADGRFAVTAQWTTDTASGLGQAVPDTADSGRFWFFAPENTEIVIKALEGCGLNDRFWVFASGLTNVEVLITVTDTQTGKTRRYFNPQGKAFAPVQDTDAFACE